MSQSPRPIATQTVISPLTWVYLVVLAMIWGASFISNRVALGQLGFLTLVAFRTSGAMVALWAYIWLRGLPVPRGRGWLLTCVLMGIFNNIVPFCLIVWGQMHIASGLAGILNAATAIFSVLAAALFFPDERLTRAKSLGVALGMAGVVVIIGPAALRAFDLSSLGQLAILGAAASYAVAGIIGRARLRGVRPEVAAAGMLTMASATLIPAALWVEGAPTLSYSPATWAALAYLALISSALAYIISFAVLIRAGAGNLGLVTLLIVPFAVGLGAVVFHEVLPTAAYLGMALLALGMAVIDGRMWRILRPGATT